MRKLVPAVVAMASLSACEQTGQSPQTEAETAPMPAAAGEILLSGANDNLLYALGVVLADRIPDLGLSDEESSVVAAGMRDSLAGNTLRVEMDTYGPQLDGFVSERLSAMVEEERVAAAAFADEIANEPGAERLASGVVFSSMIEGDGANPTAADSVTVHYHGTLRDGSVFDSSVERGTPATFPLGGVIPCWTEGVQRIKVGGKAKLLCPSDTAYGDQGTGGIPGGAALLFEVELLSIE